MPEHSSVPDGYGTVTPWIISKDSAGLIRFLEEALDAQEIAASRMLNADGSIGHVEVRIGTSIVMLFDSYDGWPDTPAFFRLYLDDADAAYRRAIGAGATSVTEVTELFWATASDAYVTRSATSGGSRAMSSTCPTRRCRRA